ncbi:activating transcription factor 7-interacting protein 1 isoform X3 [Cardiocondyla obscurior]|uniref:activating transcription factor 7-interacting protein 1 isoform X3 n=1 Tax=Cardiocondyla obscurior TaxID=286306 RepID=UPI0039657D6C
MEKAEIETVNNSEASCSVVPRVNSTDVEEMSKEKEEELLHSEEDDDEETLSDDSLRLRLSSDEDFEQEDVMKNGKNVAKLNSQTAAKKSIIDTTTEKTACSDMQKKVLELDSEESEKKHSTVKARENTALSLDERTSKNKLCKIIKLMQDTTAEKTACSDMQKKVLELDSEESEKKHSTAVKARENTALSLDERTSENKLCKIIKLMQDNKINLENINANKLNRSEKKCELESSEDVNIIDADSTCLSEGASKECIILENDNLSKSYTHTNNIQSPELRRYNKENRKNIDIKKLNSKDNYELSELDDVSNNDSSVDSVNVKIHEKLSTTESDFNSNGDNVRDDTVEKRNKNDTYSSKQTVELGNGLDCVNLVISQLLSHKDTVEHENKNKDSELVIVEESKNVKSNSKITEKVTNTSLIGSQNNSNVKDIANISNEDHGAYKSVIQTINSNSILHNALSLSKDIENEIKNAHTVVPRRKRIKKVNSEQDDSEEDKQENENMEQKRTTAKSTEEIIRKEYLKNSDSSDSNAEEFPEFVTNCKQNRGHFTSRTSLKRNCLESETFNGNIKKMKMNPNSKENKDVTQLSFIENFFRRDFKEKIPKLTQGELEELLIQKIVETIAMRSEIGQLREQARISERNQELLRGKMGQLIKQIKEFEIVLSHNEKDRRTNPDKIIPPIKINRSVALQVNYITEHGRHNSRQAANLKLAANTTNSNSPTPIETNNPPTNPKRNGIKTRSPRSIVPAAPKITQSQTVPATPVMSTVTPTALVVAKSLETPHTLTLSNQPTTIQPVLSTPQPSPIQTSMIQSQPHKAIVINGKIQNQINHPTLIAPKPRSNDLIDLTDEEEKNKLTTKVTTATTPLIEQLTTSSKPAQTYQRIIQAIPANVAITTQPTNIKMITTNQQSTSTLVNNINPPRLAYVMQSGNGSPRPVLIASNSNQQVQIRPVNATNRQQFPTVTYKPVTGVSTISNGPMRVLATPVLSSIKINKHPAPLPDIPNYAPTPGWKLPPPAPSLKISKVSNGIVLSWNMNLTEKYADIASYQLYAYQEVAGMSPNTSLWKKVGDVRALPLPMACTLTQFSEGNNYYFAVRAVDTHSRKGQYSIPGNISL